MTTETDRDLLDLSDRERDLIVRALNRVGKTITVHSESEIKEARELLSRMGFPAQESPE